MNVFEEMRQGKAYDIRNKDYQEQVHGELDRCGCLCQQINLTEGIHDTGQKTAMRVMQCRHGSRNLLAARLHWGFAHGSHAFFECCFAQTFSQHSGPRPQHQPAGFDGAIALQSLSPIF